MDTLSNKNIYSAIKNLSFEYGDKTIIAVEDEEISYKDFISETDIISDALISMGVTHNSKIGIIIPNSAVWYYVYWAIVKTGACPVPLDPQIGVWEMERLIPLAGIEICFAASKYRANNILDNLLKAAENIPSLKAIISTDCQNDSARVLSFKTFKEKASGRTTVTVSEENNNVSLNSNNDMVTAPDNDFDFISQNKDSAAALYGTYSYTVYNPSYSDILMLACTSGSTGNPKIIAVPHIGFYKSQYDMGGYLGFEGSDIMLLGMPLYHQGGFGMGLQMILRGGTVLYQPTFDPQKFLRTIEERKITVAQLTTTLAKIMLSVPDFDKYDLSSLKMCYFAGEVLPMEIAEVFFKKLGKRVINVIGSSETATMVVWDSDRDKGYDSNDFKPLPFTKMMVVNSDCKDVAEGEIGNIFTHTDALISEYYKNRQETELKIIWIDGLKWFDTGDMGMKKPGSRVQFIGRNKRIIKRGSNLIYPEEIESFLLTHPEIQAVAVTGEKHDLMGEALTAYIQPVTGHNITRNDLVNFFKGKLAAYKMPDRVVITRELPHDIGKVQFKYIKDINTKDAVL